MRRFTIPIVWLSVVCCVVQTALAAELAPVSEIEGISEYRLENGLQVLLFPDPSKPRVTVNITVFVGSRQEGYGETGMAHLLEHMLFKGTPTHQEIPRVLKERGAVYNGSTWYDRTNYYETLPASDENLEFALRLEADRLVNSLVRAEDLASEMTVVRNEFERGENTPTLVLWQKIMLAAYEWHNYGKPTIGNRADIERVPIEKLQAFYRRYYQPDNAMLVVAGQFDTAKALKLIAETFGRIPRPDRELAPTYTEEPAQDGERRVVLRRVGDVPIVGAAYHIPSGPHPEYPSVDVLESILTAAPSGRLYKALVETKEAASVFGAAFALHDPGIMLLIAEVAGDNKPDAVLDTLLKVTEAVGPSEISDEEVDRAKQRLLKQRELAATDSSRLAIELSEWSAQGDWRLYFLYRDRLEQVSAQSVRDVAAKYLKQNNRTVGIFRPIKSPDRVPIPATPDLTEMIGDYKGRETLSAGEAFDVSPDYIESRTERFTLSNGIHVAFLPKKTRGESIDLRLTLRYGDEGSLTGLAKATEFLPPLMMRGTRELTRQQIQDLLDKNRTRLSASGEPGEITLTLQTKRTHLAAALDLLRQVLREPSFPEEELDILKQKELADLEKRLTDPTALAQIAVSREITPYPKNDPRYVPTIEEEIETTRSINVSSIRSLYDEFLSSQHGELVVVGDFDAQETKQTMASILDGWTADRPYQRLSKRGDVAFTPQLFVINVPDKANATYFAATVFPLRDDNPDYAPMVLGNYLLGGSALSSRLGDRIRQKEGLSYGVGSGLQASSLDERAAFYVYAISNPDNMKRVETAVREEIERLLKHGVTAEELDAARGGYLQRLKVSRMDDSGLARQLAEFLHAGRTMAFQAELEKRLQEVTPDSLLAAMQRHLDPTRLVIATAGDFRKTTEKQQSKTKGQP